MPIRRSPSEAGNTRPDTGRDRSEQVVAINRTAWSQSVGARTRLPLLARRRHVPQRPGRLHEGVVIRKDGGGPWSMIWSANAPAVQNISI
jgi:hypothetical protein